MEFIYDKVEHPIILLKHPEGDFHIKLIWTPIGNGRGIFSKTAQDCEVNIRMMGASGFQPLYWNNYGIAEVQLKKEVDRHSPESVFNALKQASVFSKRKMTFHRGDGHHAIIGFSLETDDHFYFATDVLTKLIGDEYGNGEPFKEEGYVTYGAFFLAISGPDISSMQSKHLMITGVKWNEKTLDYITRIKEIKSTKDFDKALKGEL